MPTVVCASGYFDPIHPGHIEYLEKSKKLGDKLFVIINSDKQAAMKKGKSFMKCSDRMKIVRSLACVDAVMEACDDDRSVCASLRLVKPDIFTNGGDQNNEGVPEAVVCEELGIQMVDALGDKINSSSWIIAAAKGEEKVVKKDANA